MLLGGCVELSVVFGDDVESEIDIGMKGDYDRSKIFINWICMIAAFAVM